MALNILQSSISKAALALSALTACSAPQAQKQQEPGIHLSQADIQKQSLKGRIISALQNIGYNNLRVKQLAGNLNDNTPPEDMAKFVECFEEDDRTNRMMNTANILEPAMKEIAPEIIKCRGEMNEDPETLDTSTITCIADAAMKGGIGERVAVLTELAYETGAEIINCLESIPVK